MAIVPLAIRIIAHQMTTSPCFDYTFDPENIDTRVYVYGCVCACEQKSEREREIQLFTHDTHEKPFITGVTMMLMGSDETAR